MGKKRLIVVGAEVSDKPHSAKSSEGARTHSAKVTRGKKEPASAQGFGKTKRPVTKGGKDKGRLTDMGSIMLEEMDKQAVKETKKKQATLKKKKTTQKKQKTLKKSRSKRYSALKKQVDKTKLYPLTEAIELLLKLGKSKIDETVEFHLVTEDKLSGSLDLPHGTGKTQKIEVADEQTLTKLAKGKIDFDLLISAPAMMPKLAKYAKLLGPKGLMPNPKNNTVTDKPKELIKKLQAGGIHYKTEAKFPLLHLTIGKISFGQKKLLDNLQAAIKQIKPKNIVKATLTASQSPGINLFLDNAKSK
ncbi:hypothetical protein KKD62_02855 [Patescibacteria group bacterium]|nr:hypothetical protein [Patescibacteria group bacterium]MBU1931810.1 hypothetical protein [Patescibacteria group bacterium]